MLRLKGVSKESGNSPIARTWGRGDTIKQITASNPQKSADFQSAKGGVISDFGKRLQSLIVI